ncbi:ATP-binding protein [Spirochaeta cellobiosiphila]|uniref:ATP-binding protein n=1 Tax=Spirochaeta cellobiosiphila TaxID=504483 RepID=UPI000428B3DD|nr:ATP-binding protein [Spirochaeta cellobiosiphila]
MITELSYDELNLEFEQIDFHASLEDISDHVIIGQKRAWEALKMGTEMRSKGYNIFVSGPYGTGRTTAVRKLLSEVSKDTSLIRDIVLVYNFDKPETPRVIYTPPGKGIQFKKKLHSLIEDFKKGIPRCLNNDSFKTKRDHTISLQEQEENHQLHNFEITLKQAGFKIVQITEEDSSATDIAPIYKGKTISFEELQQLVNTGKMTQEAWNQIREQYYRYMDQMKTLFTTLRQSREQMEKDLHKLQIDTVRHYVNQKIKEVEEAFAFDGAKQYLTSFTDDILNHLYMFTTEETFEDDYGNPSFIRYGVHILVNHKDSKTAPVIFENHPTVANLFGSIETRMDGKGEGRTNFMMIRGGSLIQASGGYLVIRAEDIFEEEGSWMGLKRALQTSFAEIQMTTTPFTPIGPLLKPEPIAIKVKVIIIGSEHFYDLIYNTDLDVKKLFKVSAEFDSTMTRTVENTQLFLRFLESNIEQKKLLPFSPNGIKALLIQSIRMAEDRSKLSTRFSMMNDIINETDYWAKKENKTLCDQEDVYKALLNKRQQFSLMEEKFDNQIMDGTILLDTSGTCIGQVNGLAVFDRGYYTFGRPMRISAEVAPGKSGIVNIEREAGLSGEIHDKGVLILESYLRSYVAQEYPLSLWAGLSFDQSYNMVDGDSASSTEAYALMSALSQIPLRQELAVTGSINQRGQLQPIGGATEKIEGFYDVCYQLGLTGTQGVILPYQNVKNIILRQDILEAIKEKRFHIYPIRHISEGLRLLTGLDYQDILDKAHLRLKHYWELSTKYGHPY